MTAWLLMALLLVQTAPILQLAPLAEEEATKPSLGEDEVKRQMARLRAEAEVDEETEPFLSNWFVVYVVVMTTAAFLGTLLLILILSIKLSRISKQLNDISDSATNFIRVGLDHFKERTGRRSD